MYIFLNDIQLRTKYYCAGIILLIKSGFHFSKKKSQFDIIAKRPLIPGKF